MPGSRFHSFLKQMMEFGFEMDCRIEQKEVNGLLGMHATESIPKGAVLGKFPTAMMIPACPSTDFSADPNREAHSLIHALAKQLADENSRYRCYFEYCGSVEEREHRSVCFFTQEEFGLLEKMNPMLAQLALTSKHLWMQMIDAVAAKDGSLDKAHIMLASFIYRERCWGRGLGFLPGIDLFNHNTKSLLTPQRTNIEGEDCVVLIADKTIEAGEEIKISYGKKDMYKFAFNYDFFDPEDFHVISYSARVTQPIVDGFVQQVARNLEKHYQLSYFKMNGQTRFAINENHAFFLGQGPNKAMVDLVSRLAVNNAQALAQGRADEKTTARYMLYILQTFRSANRVQKVKRDSLPEKLRFYHDMLTAELKLLDANISAVEPRCA